MSNTQTTPLIGNTWRVRLEDSSDEGRAVSFARLSRGITDGVWSASDQARGPGDTAWRLIGEHPQLEEFIPPKPLFRSRDSEDAEMDMTPMIDVTFQLLIFFMIAATYVQQKTLEMPKSQASEETEGVTTLAELEKTNILVKLAADRTISVRGKTVLLDNLGDELSTAVKELEHAEMVLDADDEVDHETVVKVLDAAAGAKIENVHFVSRVGAPPSHSAR